MGLGLGHSMKIEACFDPVQTAFQPFGVGAVDPGKPVERRERQMRRSAASLNSRQSDVRLAW
jgi:hypothetical protein